MASSNKETCLRHYNEVLTAKRLPVIDVIYADQIQIGDGAAMTREQFKAYAAMTAKAFPDLVVTVRDQIEEGDRVVTRWTAEATHLGDFLGHAATGKRVSIKAIHIHRVHNGRIAALWEEIDLLGVAKQLGIQL